MQPNCRRAVPLLVRDRSPRNDAGSCSGVHARGRGNSVGWNSRDLNHAFKWKLVYTDAKLFKPRRPLRYEVPFVETFVDDNLKQPMHIAASGPPRNGSHMSASSAFSLRRGSRTINFAPRCRAPRMEL